MYQPLLPDKKSTLPFPRNDVLVLGMHLRAAVLDTETLFAVRAE